MDRKAWIIAILGVILIAALLFKARNNNENPPPPAATQSTNQYTDLYAGGYMVKVDGVGADLAEEVYVLHKDGSAKWMWLVPDPSEGAKIDSEKTGTWAATGGRIVISIQGKTGVITEEFKFINGRFQSTTSSDRYLKLHKSYE